MSSDMKFSFYRTEVYLEGLVYKRGLLEVLQTLVPHRNDPEEHDDGITPFTSVLHFVSVGTRKIKDVGVVDFR